MNSPIVLLYNLNGPNSTKIKLLCVKLGIRVRPVLPVEYGLPLAVLAGKEKAAAAPYNGAGFPDEMLVFVGFSSELLDAFLQGFREDKIPPIRLKAVLTPTNALWNSTMLMEELQQEHAAMEKARKK